MERRQFLRRLGALTGLAAGVPILRGLLPPVPQDEPAFILKSTWGSADMIDVTSLDSCNGYREFIGGFRDGGTITMRMNFDRNQEWEEFVNGSA